LESVYKKYGLPRSEQFYRHTAEPLIETAKVKILWDVSIQKDHVIEHILPDIVVVAKDIKMALLTDIAVTGRVEEKETSAGELKRLRKVNTNIMPIVVGALGITPKNLEKPEERWDNSEYQLLQKAALLGTARILRKVLDTG